MQSVWRRRSLLAVPGGLGALMFGVASGGLSQEVPRLELSPADAVAEARFTRVMSVRELSDGTLLVGDRGDPSRLLHIEWHSGGGSQIGGMGQGIGRLVALAGDSTLHVDLYDGRWSLLHGAQVVETLGRQGGLNRDLGSELLGADRRGRVLGLLGSSWSPGTRSRIRGTADTLVVLIGDRSTGVVETIGRIRGPGNRGVKVLPATGSRPSYAFFSNPLAVQDQALLFLDGWIAIARVDPYRVDWRTPESREIEGPPLPVEEAVVNDQERCLAMELGWAQFREDCDPELLPGWPDTVPAFIRSTVPTLLATPDGRLVIARTPSARFPGHRYDFVDREGRLTGVMTLDSNQTLIGFGASSVFVITKDELGFQELRRHRFPG